MSTGTACKFFIFGITSDQFDELDRLIWRIRAQSDVISSGCTMHLSEESLPLLGEMIFEAAETIGEIFDRIGDQTLEKAAKAPSRAAPVAGHPMFTSQMHHALVHAQSIVQVIQNSAHQAGNAEAIGGSCVVVSDLLARVIKYVQAHFDTSLREEEHG